MGWPSKRQLRRWWRPFRIVAGFALVGVAAWVITGKTSELSGASAFLTQLRWYWLLLGGLAELASFGALATVQRLLLRAGGVKARLTRLTAITFAGSSIQAALPVGAAFAGLYVFRQYELAGADEVLAGWVVIATFTVAFATLATLAGVGLAFAASTGSTFDLVGAILGVLVFAALVVVVWLKRAKAYEYLARAAAAIERRATPPTRAVHRANGRRPQTDEHCRPRPRAMAHRCSGRGGVLDSRLRLSGVCVPGRRFARTVAGPSVGLLRGTTSRQPAHNAGRSWRRGRQLDSRSCRLRWRSGTDCGRRSALPGPQLLDPAPHWRRVLPGVGSRPAGGESVLERRPSRPRRNHPYRHQDRAPACRPPAALTAAQPQPAPAATWPAPLATAPTHPVATGPANAGTAAATRRLGSRAGTEDK